MKCSRLMATVYKLQIAKRLLQVLELLVIDLLFIPEQSHEQIWLFLQGKSQLVRIIYDKTFCSMSLFLNLRCCRIFS